jgi:hypothetical protein
MRACWAPPAFVDEPLLAPSSPLPERDGHRPERPQPRTFVLIEDAGRSQDAVPQPGEPSATTAPHAPSTVPPRDAWSLWGDPEA